MKNLKINPSNLDSFLNYYAGKYKTSEEEVISRLNKVGSFTSEAMEMGKAFDKLTETGNHSLGNVIGDKIQYEFWDFKKYLVDEIRDLRFRAKHQVYVERLINVSGDSVKIYGFVDDVFNLRLQDLKTTKNYYQEMSFFDSAQWRCYLYCTGSVSFDYLITDFTNIYFEEYINSPLVELWLAEKIHLFREFVNDNREKIDFEKITFN